MNIFFYNKLLKHFKIEKQIPKVCTCRVAVINFFKWGKNTPIFVDKYKKIQTNFELVTFKHRMYKSSQHQT